MIAIVNVDKNWGIGSNNKLLYSFKTDRDFFRHMTIGNIVVYGKNTLLSLPGKKPLVGRINIVVSSNPKNIPDVSKTACNYYAHIQRSNTQNELLFAEIKLNQNFNKSYEYHNTTLITINDISLIEDIAAFIGKQTDDIYICGGESIYSQLLSKCNLAYVTMHNYHDKNVIPDKFFPNIEADSNWMINRKEGEGILSNKTRYTITSYRRKS